MARFKVGDEVVIMAFGYPCQHNTANNPEHPCRGKVLKVGRKFYHIETTGAPWKIEVDGTLGGYCVMSVEDARAQQRKNFSGPNEWRTPEFIETAIAGI